MHHVNISGFAARADYQIYNKHPFKMFFLRVGRVFWFDGINQRRRQHASAGMKDGFEKQHLGIVRRGSIRETRRSNTGSIAKRIENRLLLIVRLVRQRISDAQRENFLDCRFESFMVRRVQSNRNVNVITK